MKIEKNLKITLMIAVPVLVLLIAFVWLASVYTDYISVVEIGSKFTNVMFTDLSMGLLSYGVGLVIALVLCYWCNRSLRKSLASWDGERNFLTGKRGFTVITIAMSLFLAFIISDRVYMYLLPALKAVDFDIVDPLIGKNVSYYVFVRPLVITITNNFSSVFPLLFIYSLIVYLIYYVRNSSQGFRKVLEQKSILWHLGVLLSVFVMIMAYKLTFLREDLLLAANGEMQGGGYTDVMLLFNYYLIAPFLLLAACAITMITAFKKKYKAALMTAGSYFLIWVLVLLAGVVVRNIVVKPNEASIERPYIRHNIEFTRIGYNLNTTEELEYNIGEQLNPEDVLGNTEVMANIRITDFGATLSAYNQLQDLRNYYTFKDIDILPYEMNGMRRLGFSSVRELSLAKEDERGKSYVNKKMRYTNGYGMVLSPIDKVTNEGQPEFLISDIPQQYSEGLDLNIQKNEIYYGETESDYVIVNSLQESLNDVNVSNVYDGNSGIQLSPFHRLLYAVKYRDLNIITSGYITQNSKILTNRNVIERLETVIPFIEFDSDIAINVTDDGRLKWVVDGYTITDRLPYSQITKMGKKDFNYIRNSVKAVVDAYDGSVDLYIIDQNDPIIKTYQAIYPDVFAQGDLPADLTRQLKYPEQLFVIQADMYKKYHTTNPAEFYAKTNVYEFAKEKVGTGSEIKPLDPYYSIQTISDRNSEFMMTLPYTLASKDTNLVAWLAVGCEKSNYGRLISYQFPQGQHVYSTLQIENKIDNDPNIAKEITLWNQGGSNVLRGNMLFIPIKNSVIYLEPIYITSQNQASLPEIKRIVVACGDLVVMEKTLEEALAKLFAENPSPVIETPGETASPLKEVSRDLVELIDEIIEKHNESKLFMSENDWVNFGASMKSLDELMKELERSKEGLQVKKDDEDGQEATQSPTPQESAQSTPEVEMQQEQDPAE